MGAGETCSGAHDAELSEDRHPGGVFLPGSTEDGLAYSLSEGRVSEAALAAPGITWELVGGFADLKRGTAALRRLERGLMRPERESDDERLPPWVDTTCRPLG